MQVPSLLQSLTTTNQINTMRAQLTDLQTQLATGKKSQSHAGLGVNAGLVLDLRAELNVMDAYIRTIDQTQLRLTTVQQSLSRVDDIAAEMRTASLTSGYETIDTKQTQLQYTAAERLEEVLAVLNTDIGGRHLFGGAATQTQPVEVYDTVINGDVGRAGFKQIVSERAQADLGSDNRGRLQIPVPAGDTVTVTEDNAPPFGLKFDAVSTDLANVTAGIAGARAVRSPAADRRADDQHLLQPAGRHEGNPDAEGDHHRHAE
ncbi:flagellin [Pyruvatibacter mobilis]|uniref:flagellin n=1 Tax=Pyruvatibacter mobilis TaxID=1712261 RepID=UPI003BB2100D